ncbi:MAG: usg protein [Hyphomicrobiaceae bacterium]
MRGRDFADELAGYSLTTAEILYRLPDYPSLLQSYIWQDYDLHPSLPRLREFLDFWTGNLDGSLYQVRVASARLLKPRDVRCLAGGFSIN